jgi:glucose-6-phosphate dehydrogenase assembly protein OpcA
MENVVTSPSAVCAHAATLVVVGPRNRLAEAAGVLGDIAAGSLQSVLISTDPSRTPEVRHPQEPAITEVKPEHLNNAVASLRLSSLPTIVWWRGGPPGQLDSVATLADRLVLDAEDPAPLWHRAPAAFHRTAVTDLRWTRLTRWRAVMAHFFDLPQVRDAAASFAHLTVTGSDRAQCALFAGWLDASLGWQGRVAVELTQTDGGAPMTAAVLSGRSGELSMRLMPNDTCLDTRARMEDHVLASHVVSLGDQRLPALMLQELRVRARDLAFERALVSTGRI